MLDIKVHHMKHFARTIARKLPANQTVLLPTPGDIATSGASTLSTTPHAIAVEETVDIPQERATGSSHTDDEDAITLPHTSPSPNSYIKAEVRPDETLIDLTIDVEQEDD